LIPRRPLTYRKLEEMAGSTVRPHSNDEFIELLDALKRYGPRNLSLISLLTGIPRETVRYKVKKQLRELGFTIQMVPNVYRMGLTRLYARLTFSSAGLKIANELLYQLGLNSYLSYYGKIAFSNEYLVLINPPDRWAGMFSEYLSMLEDKEVIKEYEVQEISEVGYPHVTYRLFDFESGGWRISELREYHDEGVVVTQKASKEESANYLVDRLDLAVIEQLQADAFSPLTRVSSMVGRGPRLVRYHFQEHIVRKGLIAGYVLNWFPLGDDAPDILRLFIKTEPLSSRGISEATKAAISSPFCKFYTLLQDNSVMIYLLLDRQMAPAINQLSTQFKDHGIEGDVIMLDNMAAFSLPKEMFRDGYGWLKPAMELPTPRREAAPLSD